VLLVHSGNRIDLAGRRVVRFPSTQVPVVQARIARLLETLRPTDVVSAAAAGADLIVLEEAIRLGINVHVVLTVARDEFVEQSVMDAGPEWVTRFESVVRHVSTVDGCSLTESDDAPDHEWYLAALDQLLGRAEALAANRTIAALTVRPPEGEVPPSVTDDFAARAERIGLLVLTIDPRPASTATVTVG